MTILTPTDFSALLIGSTFFGTGGGGSPAEAQVSYDRLSAAGAQIRLNTFSDFSDDDLIITIFAVGSVTATGDHTQPVKKALARLEQELQGKIAGIIPVEIGPDAVAMVLDTAFKLGLPVVDGDIVGGRSTPEVFLETITLFNIPRTPAAIAAMDGSCEVLQRADSAKQEEQFFRSFAAAHGDQAYIVGYPMRIRQVKQAITPGTISRAVQAGRAIQSGKIESYVTDQGGKTLYSGTITNIQDTQQPGFTTQRVELKNPEQVASLFVKNESLILWVENTVMLTCPDLLILTDKNNQPIYNADLRHGLEVNVIGLPASPLWRSPAGIELFQPKTFGFKILPTLL